MKLHTFLARFSVVGLLLSPFGAGADTLTWTIENHTDFQGAVAFFYSYGGKIPEHRDGVRLGPQSSVTVELPCQTGEEICFGAWSFDGLGSWGTGHYNDEACSQCCLICGQGSYTNRLLD